MNEKLNLYFNKDANLELLKKIKIGIIGFGNQGRAQALNIRDRDLNVKVGIRANSKSIENLKDLNLKYDDIGKVVSWADIVVMLVPDKLMSKIYNSDIKENLKDDQTIVFSHGYNIHYKLITPPNNVNVVMVAPSGGGRNVRNEFKKGSGVPSLIAVHQDYSGNSFEIAKAYSRAIGSTRICSFLSTFKEETETDLFGEQVLLTGSIPYMISKSLKVLLEDGYSPEVAWFVCYYEIKTIVDLFHEKGFDFLYKSISDTARYGGITRGDYLIDETIETKMKHILAQIKDGSFHHEMLNNSNNKSFDDELSDENKEKIKKLMDSIFKKTC